MREGISIISSLVPIAALVLIVVVAFAIYKAVYKRKINKRLAEGREADIKPMMSPVKFTVITLLCTMIVLVILWGIFAVKASKRQKELAVYPSISMLRENTIQDSPFAGYSFGDDINGYMHFSEQKGDLRLEIYVVKSQMRSILPPVLVALDYVGAKEDILIKENIDYGFYKMNWQNSKESAASLTAINTGGYKGKFTYSCMIYDMAGMGDYDPKDSESFFNSIEYLKETKPDVTYELEFKTHQSGLLSCPQLGITVDSWD